MKKLRLNKIFHWLYFFLMLWPIINWIGGMAFYWFNASSFDIESWGITPWQIFLDECLPMEFGNEVTGIFSGVVDVFEYLDTLFLGESVAFPASLVVTYMLCYWVYVSLMYLIFDVLMFIINVAHHWIDEGSDKLC